MIIKYSSRVAVLETTFFVHGNYCQLFQTAPFPIFSHSNLESAATVKLISDVNNVVSMT